MKAPVRHRVHAPQALPGAEAHLRMVSVAELPSRFGSFRAVAFTPDERGDEHLAIVRGNVRDLEGCLVRLVAVASLTHQDITLELAEDVLTQYVNAEPDHMTPERILSAVSERFGVKTEMIVGQRRTQVVALPRQVAMYLLRQLTDLSLVEIGRVFGGRDHSTVLYACDKIGVRINAEEAFREKINGLISTLASG